MSHFVTPAINVSSAEALLDREFGLIPDLVRAYARERPRHLALLDDKATLDYRQLDQLMDRVAISLQRDGVRAGIAVAPLAPSLTRRALETMLIDCDANILFVDRNTSVFLGNEPWPVSLMHVLLDSEGWFAPAGGRSFCHRCSRWTRSRSMRK